MVSMIDGRCSPVHRSAADAADTKSHQNEAFHVKCQTNKAMNSETVTSGSGKARHRLILACRKPESKPKTA